MKLMREIRTSDFCSLANDAVFKEMVKRAAEQDNGKIWVTVQNIPHTRTTGYKSQNHHFNGHVRQLAMHFGWEFEDMKRHIKQRAISQGYPILYRCGKAVTDPYGKADGISESKATREQCAILIDVAHMIAGEEKVNLNEGFVDEE